MCLPKKEEMKKTIFTIVLLTIAFTGLLAKTITVTTANESGTGSLQQAIIDAADGDKIIFDQAYTIYLTSPITLGDKNITIEGNVNGELVKLDGNFLDENKDWIDDDGVFTNLLSVISSGDFTVNVNDIIIQNGSASDNWGGAWPNSNNYTGGGVYIDLTEGGTFTMTGCTIQNNILSQMDDGYDGVNQAYLRGAGIYSVNGGSFINCTIKNNTAIATNAYISNIEGAGAYIAEGGSFSNCLIAGNQILLSPINNLNSFIATGGGLHLSNKADVINCVIVGNGIKNLSDALTGYSTQAVAGGIIAQNAHVYNTTIAQNGIYNIYETSNQDLIICGGAITSFVTVGDTEYKDYCDYQNNVIYGNYCSSGDYNDGVSAPEFTKYTAIADATDFEGVQYDETCIILEENPFIELPSEGDDGEWGTDDDNYGDLRLKQSSLCIDAGNPNETLFDVLATDFYNRQRISNGIIDMGAVESLSTDFYFSLTGAVWEGNNRCSSGKVYAYSIDNTTDYRYVTELDLNGNFEFLNIEPGDYYFLAISEDTHNYKSTYFGNETTVQNAISITVDDFIYGVDIHLVETIPSTVESVKNISFNIYPNPATSIINIKGDAVINKTKLYNSVGNIVSVYNGDTKQIPVSSLKKGIYILSVEVDNTILNYQITIK